MDQFTPQTIGCALGVCAVIFFAVRGFWAWCDRVDTEWAARNPPVPDQKPIATEHVAKRQPASQRASSRLVGGLLQLDDESLARAFRQDAEVQRQMAADTIKGKRP